MERTVVYKHKVCTAHRLPNHEGKCKKLHGHNYIITLHICTQDQYVRGVDTMPDMIMDFADIKSHYGKQLDEWFDHMTVLHTEDPLRDKLVDVLGPENVLLMNNAPTAENMAAYILRYTINTPSTFLYMVDVEETPGCAATARKQ